MSYYANYSMESVYVPGEGWYTRIFGGGEPVYVTGTSHNQWDAQREARRWIDARS